MHFDAVATLITLTILEIVLGIDNLVFIAILVARLPHEKQSLARRVGLSLAMFTRCGLLTVMSYLTHMTKTLFTVPYIDFDANLRDLVLLGGGIFLIFKSVREIHESLEEGENEQAVPKVHNFWRIIGQIVLIDIIFSLDSVITAVGIADHLAIMIAAVVISVIIMMWFSAPLGDFIETHPTVKMLALCFLLLIGVLLVAEGTHHHIDKGYIYFAMAFALGVEFLNLKSTREKRAARELARQKSED